MLKSQWLSMGSGKQQFPNTFDCHVITVHAHKHTLPEALPGTSFWEILGFSKSRGFKIGRIGFESYYQTYLLKAATFEVGIGSLDLWELVCALTQCQGALQRQRGTWWGQQVASLIFPACREAGAWECTEPVGMMLSSWRDVDRATVKLLYGRDFPLLIFPAEYLKHFSGGCVLYSEHISLFLQKKWSVTALQCLMGVSFTSH